MFSLSKWYGDCIADNGDTVILYKGQLRWGSLSLAYGSILECRDGSEPQVSFSLRAEAPPLIEQEPCRWASTSLGFTSDWTSSAAPVREVLYENGEGAVDWSCRFPLGRTTVSFPDRPQLEGCGYLEHLTLTIPPWRLPIRELKWGHFVGGEHYAVWIDWQGAFSTSFATVDGVRQFPTFSGENRVEFSGGLGVDLDRAVCLREGRIGSSALAVVRSAAKLFPEGLLGITETKWRSCAMLHRRHSPDVAGWAIHERVVWPQNER
jgi:hypothetical protein